MADPVLPQELDVTALRAELDEGIQAAPPAPVWEEPPLQPQPDPAVLVNNIALLLQVLSLPAPAHQGGNFDILREAFTMRHQPQWCSLVHTKPLSYGSLLSIAMVATGNVHASPSCIPFRDPHSFVAGEIHHHTPFCDFVLCTQTHRKKLLSYINNGVDVFRFFHPFTGNLQGKSYESELPLPWNSLTTAPVWLSPSLLPTLS